VRIAIVVTSVRSIDGTWTTAHLAHAALCAGISVRFLEPHDFEVTSSGRLVGRAWSADEPAPTVAAFAAQLSTHRLPRRYVDLSTCTLTLLRVNPLPWHTLQCMRLVQQAGVPVLNDPLGVTLTRGKSWLATLVDVPRPETIITASRSSAQAFARRSGGRVVVKPATGSGGRGVTLVPARRSDLLDRALSLARNQGGLAVVQEYMPEAEHGEKRLVWVGGELIGGYLRQRAPGNFRHNLKQGATPNATELTEADLAVARAIGPHLLQNGIGIAGLDVIGGKLVEVNTLNPGGIHWADALSGGPKGVLAKRAVDRLLATAAEFRERTQSR
jgi:glutathione synthase